MVFIKAKDHPYFKMTKAVKRKNEGKPDLEKSIHKRVANFVRMCYPGIRFYSSLDGENRYLLQAAATKNLKSHEGFPDFILIKTTPYYCCLALELKSVTPYKKNGELKAASIYHKIGLKSVKIGDHLQNQNEWLEYLKANEWAAFFATEDVAKKYIENYLNNKPLKRLL